jgi:pyroglutamyl-peptidase
VDILITGYGAFGEFNSNPSAWLAENLGLPYRILPVTFAAVDEFIEQLAAEPPQCLLMLGLHGKAEKFHIELVAKNLIGETPDVAGVQAGPGPVDAAGQAQLGTTLWRDPFLFMQDPQWQTSVDAGGYLCNYIYYRALQKLEETRCGFLHVPRTELVPLEEQLSTVREIIDRVGLSALA